MERCLNSEPTTGMCARTCLAFAVNDGLGLGSRRCHHSGRRTVDVRSSHFAMRPCLNEQLTTKAVDSLARSVRSFSPRSTTTLSEPKSCDSWSQPVRLQTIIGRPVSSVRASHSPFGPHSPGHHAAAETSSCAPESRKRSAGSVFGRRTPARFHPTAPCLFDARTREYQKTLRDATVRFLARHRARKPGSPSEPLL
jgi:hypothetical protein